MRVKQIILVVVGFISLVVGCIGVVLPILPSFPFFLITLCCFAKSSQRLHDWFVGTKMFRNHLQSFVEKKGMTRKSKCYVMISITLLMSFGFYMMDKVPVGRIILSVIWLFHMLYFAFFVRTRKDVTN